MSFLDDLVKKSASVPCVPRSKNNTVRLQPNNDGGVSRVSPVPREITLPKKKTEVLPALPLRTVWRWRLDNGDGGTLFSDCLTYDEACKELEAKFHSKVSYLQFMSVVAEGRGFTDYQPETIH